MNKENRARYLKTKKKCKSISDEARFKRSHGYTVAEDILQRSSRKTLVYKEFISPKGLPNEPIVIVQGDQVSQFYNVSTWMGDDPKWHIVARLLQRKDRHTTWYKRMRVDRDGNLWMKPGQFWRVFDDVSKEAVNADLIMKMATVLETKGYKPKTIKGYVTAIKAFSESLRLKTLQDVRADDVIVYLTGIENTSLSLTAKNRTVCALQFFFSWTLGTPLVFPKPPRHGGERVNVSQSVARIRKPLPSPSPLNVFI